MNAPPKWAQELTLNALLWWEEHGHLAPEFALYWRRGSQKLASGTSYLPPAERETRIVITAGKSRLDAKLVLLHEIAHQLINQWHTDAFWDIAWQLYRWAGLPIRYCQKREYAYKARAAVAYRRNRRGAR